MNSVSATDRLYSAPRPNRHAVFPTVLALLAMILVAVTAALYIDMPRTSGQASSPRAEETGYQPDSTEPPVMDARLES